MNNRYICKAKRKDNGEWVDGYYVRNGEHYYIFSDKLDIINKNFNWKRYEVIPETIGRCIGLKDKNGKWIFEGDVVKADGYIFIVRFGKCGGVANNENYGYMGYYLDGFDSMTKNVLRFGLRNDICHFTDIKVIGNIHDNPELLEVQNG